MGKYVAEQVIKLMIRKGQKIYGAKVLQLGITFKENCPDIRNSHAVDVVKGLQDFGCEVTLYDPWADPAEVEREYGVSSTREIPAGKFDAIVMAVSHREFNGLSVAQFRKKQSVVFDIKGILPVEETDGRL